MNIKEGDWIIANGYPAIVEYVHHGELEGMADVKLKGGPITTCLSNCRTK